MDRERAARTTTFGEGLRAARSSPPEPGDALLSVSPLAAISHPAHPRAAVTAIVLAAATTPPAPIRMVPARGAAPP